MYKDVNSRFLSSLLLHFLHLPGTTRRQGLSLITKTGLATEKTVSKHLLSA